MSQFTTDLFLEPNTKQYGSHMVMTNVTKQTKVKYVNIDTRFRDEYNYLSTVNYNLTLPQRITDVKTMTLTAIEIPMSIYNISSNIGNNCFSIQTISPSSTSIITIPDGYYTIDTLKSAINNALSTYNLTYNYSGLNSQFSLINAGTSITINFDITKSGTNDKYNVKSKLGWILGFRNITYVITRTVTTSESFIDLNGPRYLYVALDEYNKGNQFSFVSPLYTSLINKNIIARISMDTATHPYGKILPANLTNGLLVSDTRSYTGKIDLLKLNLQLLDENGNNVNLNGLDFSFCLAVEHE
jgi:hypothetical protein